MENTRIREMPVKDLLSALTEDFVTGDHFAYEGSKNAHELKRRGKEIIPQIGLYMKSIKQSLEIMKSEEDREEIKNGWIGFLQHLIKEFDINIETYIKTHKYIVDYDEWTQWAIQFET